MEETVGRPARTRTWQAATLLAQWLGELRQLWAEDASEARPPEPWSTHVCLVLVLLPSPPEPGAVGYPAQQQSCLFQVVQFLSRV